ncbi:glucosaminidase domain-containing protein [Microlunatus sp. GCM10028923]|uniref:glucosaminidase domain-containing protein n=1 Tax=Microlunatus sp. GCM10028923 TaxID=3273400 RepID=UPI0036121630
MKSRKILSRFRSVFAAGLAVTGIVAAGLVTAQPAQADPQSYFAKTVPGAQATQQEFRVPASVTLAQSALESAWGASKLSKNDNNYFGIKCGSGGDHGPIAIGCHDYPTEECTPGCHTEHAYFRVYRSTTDGLRDYGRILSTLPRYAAAFKYVNNPDQFAREVQKGGWATDPDYANKLISIMKKYNLYKYNTGAPSPKPAGTVGDFSGDGFSDILGADAKGNLFYYPNNSNATGKFKPALGIRATIGHGWSSYPHLMSADFSGDRHADVLAVDTKGNLFYYPNNSNATGKWKPALGKRIQLGHGWIGMKFVQAADFSGDGHADLIAVDTKGNLLYYPNNSKATGTWKPALGKPIVIGHGWSTMKFVQSADFSGDKHADIIAVDTKGGMYYYPNNSNATGKFKPALGKRTQIGHGWNTMKHLQAADFSGDKHADIIAVDTKGGMYYYPNNSRATGTWQPALGKRTQIGHGWTTFQAIACPPPPPPPPPHDEPPAATRCRWFATLSTLVTRSPPGHPMTANMISDRLEAAPRGKP